MKKMFILVNVLENILIGIFNENEFIDKIRIIAVENEDHDMSIQHIGEAKDYVKQYCTNLVFRVADFSRGEVLEVLLNYGVEATKENSDIVLLNYKREKGDMRPSTEIINETITRHILEIEENIEWDFNLYQKVITWVYIPIKVEAKSHNEAKEKALKLVEDGKHKTMSTYPTTYGGGETFITEPDEDGPTTIMGDATTTIYTNTIKKKK